MKRLLLPAMFGALIVAACGSSPVAPDLVDLPDGGDAGQQGCARTSVGLTPLTDLTGTYQGEPGGLYPAGSAGATAHLAAGAAIASGIGPLDATGVPSPSGRYGFVSIGMSNTTQEFRAFMTLAAADPTRDPSLVIVDGAQGGQTAADWANPSCNCWSVLDQRIRNAGLTGAQITTAWLKLADRQPAGEWPAYARMLQAETAIVLQRLKARFPNLALAYLSSRIYAGYATTTLNPEPYAYQSAFSVRWVIDDQLAGAGNLRYAGADAPAPWVGWGPYLWADGLNARSDGLTWSCSDLQDDGTHPSVSGRDKVAQMLLRFLQSDPGAREWYVGG